LVFTDEAARIVMNELSLKLMLALHAYSLLWLLLSPVIACYLLYRSLRQPAYRKHWFERFALKTARVSTGTTGASARRAYLGARGFAWRNQSGQQSFGCYRTTLPKHRLLLTHGTPTGRQAGKDRPLRSDLPQGQSLQLYLPYDNIWAAGRFFDQYQPKIGIMIETEVSAVTLTESSSET
jgi:3-deoxy-D-manno-octulosonic-acid transferase